jgi:hypothetical protein
VAKIEQIEYEKSPVKGVYSQYVFVKIERYSIYDDAVIYFLRFENTYTNEVWVYQYDCHF